MTAETTTPNDIAIAAPRPQLGITVSSTGFSVSITPLMATTLNPDQGFSSALVAFGAGAAVLSFSLVVWPEFYSKASYALDLGEKSGRRKWLQRDWSGLAIAVTVATLLVGAIYLGGSESTRLEIWLLLTVAWLIGLGLFLFFTVWLPAVESSNNSGPLPSAEDEVLSALTKEPDDSQTDKKPWVRLFLWVGMPVVSAMIIDMIAHPGRVFGGYYWPIFFHTAVLSAVVCAGRAIYTRRPAAKRTKDQGAVALYLVVIALSLSLTIQYRIGWTMDRSLESAIVLVALLFVPMWTLASDLWASEASWRVATINSRVRTLRLEKANLDARLRTLQAQIEPHFLFNTLANVSALIDSSPATARLVVDRLSDYLRTSLDRTREGKTTLGQELDSVRAYLEISAARMGSRLRWQIDAGDTPTTLPLAPLLVQPLVENAVRHGLEPEIDGGTVKVEVRQRDQVLIIEIADTGRGMTETSGAGLGLANVRERLRALYGPDARLVLEQNEPKGLRARLEIPLA